MWAPPMCEWRDQEARNETVFREMNEWTREANDARLGVDLAIDPIDVDTFGIYLCECSDSRCTDPISLTRQEYESVRSVSIRFAIALDHENPEIDRVVTESERFATVEKFHGSGGRIARATDPRR